jgi:hypothetical protein
MRPEHRKGIAILAVGKRVQRRFGATGVADRHLLLILTAFVLETRHVQG